MLLDDVALDVLGILNSELLLTKVLSCCSVLLVW